MPIKSIPQRIRAAIGSHEDEYFKDEDIINYANSSQKYIVSQALQMETQAQRSVRALDQLRTSQKFTSLSFSSYFDFYTVPVQLPDYMLEILYAHVVGGEPLQEIQSSEKKRIDHGLLTPSVNEGFYVIKRAVTEGQKTIFTVTINTTGSTTKDERFEFSDGYYVVSCPNQDTIPELLEELNSRVNESESFRFESTVESSTQIKFTSKREENLQLQFNDKDSTGVLISKSKDQDGYSSFSSREMEVYLEKNTADQEIEVDYISEPRRIDTDDTEVPDLPPRLYDAVIYGAIVRMSAQEEKANIKDFSSLLQQEIQTNLY